MVAVGVAIPLEKLVQPLLGSTTLVFTAWSAIEEIIKYGLAFLTVLHRYDDDEPIDPVIYMVTVALGFAAAENTLFLLSPLSGDTVTQTILTGDLRFVGATLLHVLSSAVIGVALALSFYKPRKTIVRYAVIGVILAAALHASFNFLILNTPEEHLLRTFGLVWLGLIVLLAMLEYIKRIHPAVTKKLWR
jgi:RsiW-degrading membrane proteinase PrsW (M82 family)